MREHQPEDFGAWLHRRQEGDEATLERVEGLYKQRHAVTYEHTVAIKPKKKTLDGADKAKAPKQTRSERELKERVDAELRRAAGIASPEAPKNFRGPKR